MDAHGDHRLAMALCLVGLAGSRPVTVLRGEVIGESFPEFVDVLQSLGADLRLGAMSMPARIFLIGSGRLSLGSQPIPRLHQCRLRGDWSAGRISFVIRVDLGRRGWEIMHGS